MDAQQLRQAAHNEVLDGLRAGRSLAQIEAAVARCRSRGVYEPDLAMLELIISALNDADASPEQPLDTSDWRKRYLPEINFRNKHTEVQRLVYALQAAAAFRTGLRPDILDDTYGWGGAALLPYATRAAVMTIRAVSAKNGLEAACDRIGASVVELT